MSTNPYRTDSLTGVGPLLTPWWLRNISSIRAYTFFAIWAMFAIWAFQIVSSSSDGDGAMVCAVATITGPMVGAISRDFQSCCLACSLSILPYSTVFLGVGIGVQFVKLKSIPQSVLAIGQLFLWVVGWLGWFFGGTVSFLHAMG